MGSNLVSVDWFKQGLINQISEGRTTLFWHDPWVGNFSLSSLYEILFLISENQNDTIFDKGEWLDGVWTLEVELQLEEASFCLGGNFTN